MKHKKKLIDFENSSMPKDKIKLKLSNCEEEEKDMAINAQAKLFPDYAITFEQVKASGTVKQKNLDLQLKYTIHMFTLHDHEPHKQYKSTSIIYTQTDEEHTHSECALVKPIVFVPSIYYHW